ncbi:hypothetical protein [Pseudoalteromonas spongiae]|uniref:hypothetical protein n=1 Tax=Pseudoalteromonas spongiae TaxID=298657 RepID=UPI00026C9051|nr:hypothetical protein [Pseudoalteromonas spongiae]ATD00160.1 hypothetical protein PSPO_b0051 [Pseudoalteromonas spongiae UST010723-006]
MYNLLMDKASLSQVFLAFAPMEALKVKHNIDYALEALSLPSAELLAEMQVLGIDLPDKPSASKKVDLTTINSTVLSSHLTELFLDKHKLLKTFSDFSLSEQVELRAFLQSLMPMLHLPPQALVEKMQREGVLDVLMGESDKAKAVKDKIAALSQSKRDHKVDEVKERLAKLSNKPQQCADELKIARVKANLNKASATDNATIIADAKQKIVQLG